jgi:hypothetical protein
MLSALRIDPSIIGSSGDFGAVGIARRELGKFVLIEQRYFNKSLENF